MKGTIMKGSGKEREFFELPRIEKKEEDGFD